MKKLICSVMAAIVFLLSPLSAFASTTESMMMYSVMPLSDDGIAVAAAVSDFDLKMQVGSYDMRTDTFTWGSSMSYTSTNGVLSSSGGVGHNFDYNTYTGVAVRFTFSDFGQLSQIRAMLGRMNMSIYDSLDTSVRNRYYMYTDKYRVMTSFADYHFEGMLNTNGYHRPSYTDSTESISPNVLTNFPGMSLLQLLFDLNVSPTVPPPADENSILYNTGVTEFTATFVFYINDAFRNDSTGDLLDNISEGDDIRWYAWIGDNVASITGSSYGDTTGMGSLTSVINTTISNLSDSVSKQVTSVKTQLTQSTNTITTKIDTMSSDIKTGLNNVISNAQQNTQNIINTVTQKVDQLKTGITEVKDSILDLPNKIQEMLLGLIVPDSDTMASKYSEFSGLLEEKLGVIYQIPMMLFDFFDTIVNAATTPQTSLTLPAFTLPWIDGSTLTVWQPIEYKIIPEGLEVLSDLIKTVTSMTVVVLTFNSVKRAYERFLRS